MSSSRALAVLMLIALAMVAWREIHYKKRVPVPFRFVGVGVSYGLLSLLELVMPQLALVIGTGLLIPLAIRKEDETKPTWFDQYFLMIKPGGPADKPPVSDIPFFPIPPLGH